MNWILLAFGIWYIIYGLIFVSQTGKVKTLVITPRQSVSFMIGSMLSAVVMFIAAWRLG